ncbi:Golgi apparatus membrane protein TVP38 [Mycena metata]|uniref:Golgi apparatus membrane protein TVP38 n=1 Tax=Mycena metata TaxID=1033252 RepID=A0AAD7KBV3_9AGAR|nr:Golgi apparatus membrane protein TVP38 [Mycena metata]
MASYLNLLKSMPRWAFRRYQKLPFYGKVVLWLWTLLEIALVIAVIIISPSVVAQFLYDNAEKLASYPLGWTVVIPLVLAASFPPLHGHTTITTLCGFAWGLKGFFIAAPASVLGAAVVFSVLRFSFKERLRAMSKGNEKWQALESVIAAKGLPLIILIRISPFPPWAYSNVLFASIGSVSLWQFIVATCFVFPKIFVHVFIGSRIAALSDGEQRSHMDTNTKIINGVLIGGGIFIAILASWLVYTSVQKHIRNLPGISPETDELAAEALEDSEEAPLLNA